MVFYISLYISKQIQRTWKYEKSFCTTSQGITTWRSVSFHHSCCKSFFFFFFFILSIAIVSSWARRNVKLMRGLSSDKTLGQPGDWAKLHQVIFPSLRPLPFSFNQRFSGLVPSSLGGKSNVLRWCQRGSNQKVNPQTSGLFLCCIALSAQTPLRHVRLFLQSE